MISCRSSATPPRGYGRSHQKAKAVPLRLERLVTASPSRPSLGGWVIEFDASIYGGGALLRDGDNRVVEYFAVVWDGSEAPHLGVVTHDTSFQSFWEFATLLLALCTWGDRFVHERFAVLGDNTAALSSSLALKGRGVLLAVARELSWRQSRRLWAFDVGHLPSEHNEVADALSRTTDPKGCAWPSAALASAVFRKPPRLVDLWLARPRSH